MKYLIGYHVMLVIEKEEIRDHVGSKIIEHNKIELNDDLKKISKNLAIELLERYNKHMEKLIPCFKKYDKAFVDILSFSLLEKES